MVNSDVVQIWWSRIRFLTFAHARWATCVKASSWRSARPHYLSANRGHAGKDNTKHCSAPRKLRGGVVWVCGEEVGPPLSATALCRLVEQILLWPPSPKHQSWSRSPPCHHEAPLMEREDEAGGYFSRIFYEKTQMEIPAVASTPSVPQSRLGFAKKARR